MLTFLEWLDVKQEKRIDDFWNVDGSNMSHPCMGFSYFSIGKESS